MNDRSPTADPRGHRRDLRRRRQADELVGLCRRGDLTHAVALAFEHTDEFGAEPAVLAAVAGAVRAGGVDPPVLDLAAELADRCLRPDRRTTLAVAELRDAISRGRDDGSRT